MKFKKALSLFMGLSLLMALVMTACSPNSKDESKNANESANEMNTSKGVSEPNAPEEAPVTLDFWVFPKWNGITGTEKDGQPGDWEKLMADKFMESYPHVKIVTEVFDFKSGPQKVSISLAAGTIPDVMHDGDLRLMDYANKGYVLPLNDYLQPEDLSDYYDGVLDTTSIGDGKYYYLPFGTAPTLMMVNKTLFKKAGADHLLPQNAEKTWTFDEYYNAIKTAQEKLEGVNGTALFADTSSADQMIFSWIWGHGGRIVNDTLDKVVINEPKAIDGWRFWKKLVDDKLSVPGVAGFKQADTLTLFDQQKVLTVPTATVQYARAVKAQADGNAEKFDIELVMMPNAEGEKPISSGFPHGFAVFKKKDENQQKWAVEFAKFLTSKENAGAVNAANEYSFRKSQKDLYENSSDLNMKFASTAMNYQMNSGATTVGYTMLRNSITPHLQAFYLNKKTIEQFVSDVEQEGNKILQDSRDSIASQKAK